MGNTEKNVALRLCDEIREENHGKWHRWTTWMCWGCTTFSKSDVSKRCVAQRGCVQVNARLAQEASQ